MTGAKKVTSTAASSQMKLGGSRWEDPGWHALWQGIYQAETAME